MNPQYRGAVFSAALSVVFLGIGGFLATSTDVSCGDGGEQMQPGDQCVTIAKDGTRSVQTYDEALSSQRTGGGLTGGALGLAFVGLAGYQVIAGRRRDRESAAAAQATRELLAIPLPPEAQAPAAAPPPTVPTDAVQAAYGAQLGGYVRSMQPGKRSAMLVYLGLLALVAIFLFALVAGQGGATMLVFGVIALVCVGIFAAVLVRSPLVSKKARLLGFHLFAHGFVQATAAGVQAYRWDQIITIYQSIIRQKVYGATTNTNYSYILEFADGRSLRLNNFSADMRELGPILQDQVARVQVPRAMRYLHAGRAIPFGAYTVNAGGVANGGRSAPWTDIAGVKIENGGLRLCRPGGKSILGGRKVRDIPNFLTFVTLVEAHAGRPMAAPSPANG
ncbi:DUF6585 family protein [Dactylosporangium sp. CS-033363]|uniref:DUF6585 family protein n=1 Tax=Dactylosporangium sp. CS-033363 TaxID=3239935 RepID=UPI003D92B173